MKINKIYNILTKPCAKVRLAFVEHPLNQSLTLMETLSFLMVLVQNGKPTLISPVFISDDESPVVGCDFYNTYSKKRATMLRFEGNDYIFDTLCNPHLRKNCKKIVVNPEQLSDSQLEKIASQQIKPEQEIYIQLNSEGAIPKENVSFLIPKVSENKEISEEESSKIAQMAAFTGIEPDALKSFLDKMKGLRASVDPIVKYQETTNELIRKIEEFIDSDASPKIKREVREICSLFNTLLDLKI